MHPTDSRYDYLCLPMFHDQREKKKKTNEHVSIDFNPMACWGGGGDNTAVAVAAAEGSPSVHNNVVTRHAEMFPTIGSARVVRGGILFEE